MKIDRLLGIVIQLINHKKRTAKSLAEYFGVSTRTILRDIDTLTLAGIPIYSEQGKNGGYQLLESYQITKNFLNKSEAEIMMALISGLDSSVPFKEIAQIKEKFKSLQDYAIQNERMLILSGPLTTNNQHLKDKLDTILNAIDERQKIRIEYISQKLVKTKRTIHPYKLIMMAGQWYVDAFCELRKDYRLFKLFRILNIHICDEGYILNPEHLDYNWKKLPYDLRTSTQVIIKLDSSLIGKLPDYLDYNVYEMQEDGIKVTLDYPVDEWLYSFLMQFVPYIRIIEPKSVKDEFVKRLRRAIELQI